MTDIFAQRRQQVLEQLAPGGVMVLSAAPELLLGRDTHLRYLVDADFYYLTGYTEPDAVLVLDPGSAAPFTVFVRARDPEQELWHGPRAGVEGAQAALAAQAAFPISEMMERLPKLLAQADTLYVRTSDRADVNAILQRVWPSGRAARARTGRGPHVLRDPGDILDQMRVIKDVTEIGLLREAARISAQAFLETIPRIRPGMHEWEVEAIVEFGFRSRGASGPAFTTIAAAAHNATVLHYVDNRTRTNSGELLLLDAGARYQMYCADITRTVPVSGRYSAEQRALYDVVLTAHQAAVEAVRPGAPVDGIHDAARHALINGLVQSGLVSAAQRTDEAALKTYFPHRTSHWLGLEVHDVGAYTNAHEPVLLQPGMVLTIEPGLYWRERSMGIRIEDDLLVTDNGHEILTAALPATAEAIESLFQ
jgi:Xaa-Pro aminopeptidase